MGRGCAIPYGVMIPTPDGYKEVQKLRVNDQVYGLDGKPVRVRFIRELDVQNTYKIYMDSNKVIYAGGEQHIPVAFLEREDDDDQYPKLIIDKIPVDKLFNTVWNIQLDHSQMLYRYMCPFSKSVQYPFRPIRVRPDIAGFILGSIDLSEKQFTIHTDDIMIPKTISEYFGYYFDSDDDTHRFYNRWGKIKTKHIRRLVGISFYATNLDYRIPEKYKYNTNDIRSQMLTGMMLSCPFNIKSNMGYECLYASKNKDLCFEFMFVMSSLSIKCYINKMENDLYVIYRHADIDDDTDAHVIINIKKDEDCRCRSITTDSSNGIFLIQQYVPVSDGTIEF